MKRIYSLLVICLVVLLSSCGTISKKTGVVVPIACSTSANQVKADLDISKTKVKGYAKRTYFFGGCVSGNKSYFEDPSISGPIFGSALRLTRSNALYNAVQNSGCDILIDPQYESEVHSWFFGLVKSYSVNVTGYGAKIKDLHQEL